MFYPEEHRQPTPELHQPFQQKILENPFFSTPCYASILKGEYHGIDDKVNKGSIDFQALFRYFDEEYSRDILK